MSAAESRIPALHLCIILKTAVATIGNSNMLNKNMLRDLRPTALRSCMNDANPYKTGT